VKADWRHEAISSTTSPPNPLVTPQPVFFVPIQLLPDVFDGRHVRLWEMLRKALTLGYGRLPRARGIRAEGGWSGDHPRLCRNLSASGRAPVNLEEGRPSPTKH
jgi:hypothetical protein